MEIVWASCFSVQSGGGGGVCARLHACLHTRDLLWTFSCQSLTICVVINVLSPRAYALDIEMRAEMPEGRGKEE